MQIPPDLKLAGCDLSPRNNGESFARGVSDSPFAGS